MKIEDALKVLDGCNWLKVSNTHVSAAKWRTRAEILELIALHGSDYPHLFREADVTVRRKKEETFEALLIRAATLVSEGHLPKVRVPPLTSRDKCACGATGDLVWNQPLKQRMCRRCAGLWAGASHNNDIGPTSMNRH